MNIKHQDVKILTEKPFLNCKLDREKHAVTLTNIINNYKNGFVLAINNEWGTGKTTFVKMWQRHLELQKYTTLYFNAWENDFHAEPLVALMAELNSLVKEGSNKAFQNLLSKGAVLTKNVLPHILKSLSKKYTGIENISELVEDTTEGLTEIFSKEIDDYKNKKKGLNEFKLSLQEFIKESNNEQPMVFFIDELDRCKPSYSVEILEQIKHLFSVPGIIFVLSIDKVQLGNAVRGFYGSENIDSVEYLRRFIDLEYSLPLPKSLDFCNYLFDYFEFSLFFAHTDRLKFREFLSDKQYLINMSATLFEKNNLSLRQQEKIYSHARISINFFTKKSYLFPELLICLVFIRNFYPALYSNLRLKKLSLQDLAKEFSLIVPNIIENKELKNFIYVESLLIFMYNNNFENENYLRLSENTGNNQQIKLPIESMLDKSSEQKVFSDFIMFLLSHRDFGRVNLDYLIEKIEMTGDFVPL